MKKLLIIFIIIVTSVFMEQPVMASEIDIPIQETVTILVCETPRLKATKILTIEKGQTVNWWTPSLENTEFADDPGWVFAHWYCMDTQEIVTNETKFYQDCSIYAVWDYEIPETPPVAGYLPGYDEEDTDDSLVIQQVTAARPVIKNLKNIKGKKLRFTIKNPIEVDDYEIRYATNRKLKGYKKLYNLFSNKYTTIKKLKKGKTYYIKIRGCKVCNAKICYTKWSKIKRIKIKK